MAKETRVPPWTLETFSETLMDIVAVAAKITCQNWGRGHFGVPVGKQGQFILFAGCLWLYGVSICLRQIRSNPVKSPQRSSLSTVRWEFFEIWHQIYFVTAGIISHSAFKLHTCQLPAWHRLNYWRLLIWRAVNLQLERIKPGWLLSCVLRWTSPTDCSGWLVFQAFHHLPVSLCSVNPLKKPRSIGIFGSRKKGSA